MLFSRLDGNLKSKKDIEPMNQSFTTFHELMIAIQSTSNGALPHSIDHFMEQTLSEHTQQHLLKSVNEVSLCRIYRQCDDPRRR